MAFDTVANIVSDAAIELGLVSTAISDPYASTDASVLQMNALLKSLGQELAASRNWSQLMQSYTFSLVNGTSAYALPTDFDGFVDQSAWDRTTKVPLSGPLSPQQWELTQAQSTSLLVYPVFRIWKNKFEIYPTPTATDTVAYSYRSRYWVVPSGQTVPTTDAPTASTDTLWFDRLLLKRGLKLLWRRAKREDTSAEQEDYDKSLAEAVGNDGAAPVLSLTGGWNFGRLLDWRNIPDTGYGT